MGKFREAFDAGSRAVSARVAHFGVLRDPVGEDHERQRLLALRKWRFVFIRGLLGWGLPMFVWMAVSHFADDVRSAGASHESILQHLFHSWIGAFTMSALLGIVVGILAWRRLTSDIWPGTKPDPESSITHLGSLGPGGR